MFYPVPVSVVLFNVKTSLDIFRVVGRGGGGREGQSTPPFLGANIINSLCKVLGQRSVQKEPFYKLSFKVTPFFKSLPTALIFSVGQEHSKTCLVLGVCPCIYEAVDRVGSAGDQIQEIIFAVLKPLRNPAPTENQTRNTTWSVLGPPYRHLLQSAGATEGLFVLGGRISLPDLHGVALHKVE